MKILDTYQGHGPLTVAGLKGYDRVILKLYDPASYSWTKDSIAFCRAHDFPFDVYSTGGGRHEPAATWKRATEIMDALGLDPQKQAVGIDWFEFLVGGGMDRTAAGVVVHAGVNAAHAEKCKVGGYGAVLNAWPVYDALHIPFDWDWVADPQDPPRRRCHLHQMVQGGQDVDYTKLDQAAWAALTTTQDDPGGGGDMAGEADKVFEFAMKKGATEGDLGGDFVFDTGYRYGYRGVALTAALAASPDAQAGHARGTAQRTVDKYTGA